MTTEKQQNDGLFSDISIEELENHLLTVDVPDEEEIIQGAIDEDEQPGSGEPGAGGEDDKNKGKPPEKPETLITVDTGTEPEAGKTEEGEDEKDKSKGGSAPDSERESPVFLHAAALKENGVLPNFDLESLKDLDPAESILKINEHIQSQIDASIKDGVDDYKNGIGNRALEFIENLEKGIPFEAAAENYSLEQQYGSITDNELEKNEELQEAIYRDFLNLKGFSEAKINKLVDMAKEKEELLVESKDGLGEINKAIQEERREMRQTAERRQKEAEERNKKVQEDIKNTVNGIDEMFPGVKVTEADKKEIIKMMTVPAEYEERNGRKIPISTAMQLRKSDPIFYEARLNYLINKGFFEKDLKNLKMDTFLKKQESSAANKLIDRLAGEVKKPGKPAATVDKEESEKDNFVFPQDIM